MKGNKQAGFSIVEAVLAVLIIGAMAAAGVFVYQHNRTKPTDAATNKQPASQPTQTQPTTTSATYTSTTGGFSFTYPAGWKVTEQPPIQGVDTDDRISIDAPYTA